MNLRGLTKEQVEIRKNEGKVNVIPKAPSRSILQIIRANLFTTFNAINLGLAIVVLLAGSFKNSIFGFVIVVNALIGIVQELKAKMTIEKLSLLNMDQLTVVRDGENQDIKLEELVQDDTIFLKPGYQIPADSIVLEQCEFEVDESLLTGESDPVIKRAGDSLLSGSFVVAGSGYAEVCKVGKDTYAAKLANEAKKFKKINSKLQKSIDKIFKIIIWIVIPTSMILVITQLMFTDRGWNEAILGAVSGVIGMIPEGLVLLTSATLVVAVIRLSKWNALVQELPATEVLAMVDTLCLDKTGTITEGRLKVTDVVSLNNVSMDEIEFILKNIISTFPAANSTQKAIEEKYEKIEDVTVLHKIPFSSRRKWSSITMENEDTFILGAPEIILQGKYEEIREQVEEEAKKGRRVILLAKVKGVIKENKIDDKVNSMALILLEDVIKKEAAEVINYFHNEGVNLKIISGDNPITVAAVAKKVGIKDADKYVDANELPEDIDELSKVVDNIKVFGRVTPHQKKNIVKALQKNKHTVAMTGDGVNDVLALKESDCGIAMANGAQAARSVAQLVLLDSDFNALPEVVMEGRRSINNLKRVAELFITKTVYSIILSLVFALICKPFPILPIQLSLIGSATIGIPGFFLAMGPNKEKLENGFFRKVLQNALPNGIVIAISTIVTYLMALHGGVPLESCRTLAVLVLGGTSLIVLTKVSMPLNIYKILLVIAMIGVYVISFITPIGKMIFSLNTTIAFYNIIAILIIILTIPCIEILSKIMKKYIIKYIEIVDRH